MSTLSRYKRTECLVPLITMTTKVHVCLGTNQKPVLTSYKTLPGLTQTFLSLEPWFLVLLFLWVNTVFGSAFVLHCCWPSQLWLCSEASQGWWQVVPVFHACLPEWSRSYSRFTSSPGMCLVWIYLEPPGHYNTEHKLDFTVSMSRTLSKIDMRYLYLLLGHSIKTQCMYTTRCDHIRLGVRSALWHIRISCQYGILECQFKYLMFHFFLFFYIFNHVYIVD